MDVDAIEARIDPDIIALLNGPIVKLTSNYILHTHKFLLLSPLVKEASF